ncbi:MAG: hypothetical protein DRP45_03685 [Candidatus Zixiibacteriota bacterium]|nr:MAG: hypothetical protein DRP45_03685 [candidate division Zixibacteria bacterium]
MDWRDSKTQKIVIGVIAFFIIVYFWHSRAYSRYNSQITAKNQEFEMIATNLRNVEMKAKSLDALKLEYKDLIGRYDEIESLLPEVEQVPSILVQLHTASSLTGTRITTVHPMSPLSEEFYNVSSFGIEMTGTYHDVGKFISYVANFPFIANVSEFQVEAQYAAIEDEFSALQPQDNVREVGKKKETVTVTFVLSTYFVKENERLMELSFEET